MQNLIPRILHDKIGKLQLQYKYNMAGSILRGLTWFVIDGEASKMGLRQGPALAGPVGSAALQAHAGAAVLHDLRGRSGNPGKVLVLVAKEAFLNTLLSACSPLYESNFLRVEARFSAFFAFYKISHPYCSRVRTFSNVVYLVFIQK